MMHDLSREDKRQTRIEEERNHWKQEASQLRGEVELLKRNFTEIRNSQQGQLRPPQERLSYPLTGQEENVSNVRGGDLLDLDTFYPTTPLHQGTISPRRMTYLISLHLSQVQ